MDNNVRDLYFLGDDKIGRGKYAQNLMEVILNCDSINRNNDNESYVIGIDAPWGTGKTQFVSMMKNYLEGKWKKEGEIMNESDETEALKDTGANEPENLTSIDTIYYDAWSNDFWNNAFEPFFDCIMNSDCLAKFKEKEDFKSFFSAGKNVVEYLLSSRLKKIVGEDNVELFGNFIKEGANAIQNNNIEKLFPEYTNFRDSIIKLRKGLKEIIAKNGRIVIIIDELDRCKPSFAVQTLEIVKHLFNVKGLVFIFSLDIKQLSHSVKAVYGDGFEAIGYLERFFNYMTLLPTTHTYNIIQLYCKEFEIDISRNNYDNVINAFRIISKMFDLSLRDVRTVFHNYNILHHTILKQYQNIPNAQILYFYFLTMKYKMPVLFYNAVNTIDKTFKEYLNSHAIPFIINTTNPEIRERFCESFIESFNNTAIKENTFSILNFNTMRPVGKYIIKCFDNRENEMELYNREDKLQINDKINASMILYSPDIINYNNIKDYSVMEYIYRQLEMCDFIKSSEVERICHDEYI